MKSEHAKILLVLAGTILFNLFFWQEKIALNAILFAAFILAAVFYLYPSSIKRKTILWLLLAHSISAATLLIHNTVLSKLAFCGTLLLVVIYVQYLHRSVWYAAGSAISNYALMIVSFFDNLTVIKSKGLKFKNFRKAIRFLIIPIMILAVFFLVYSFANAVFRQVVDNMASAVERFMTQLLSWFNWQRFGFLMVGLFITGGLLLRSKAEFFTKKDNEQTDDLNRKRKNLKHWKESALFDLLTLFMGRFANGVMALRNENTVGIISLVLLNVLLLFINCLDIIYVWFGFSYTPDLNLTKYVHEGAGMLIFSIVLAMLVLLFFFRGNLNFYKKNKWLRYGAYAWIIQNVILVISVLFRDYYYIQHMGLAYKRIGVLVFLAMVLMGLITMFIKIHQRKSTYYLLRINGWFAIVLLVASSCIHWDEQIANYNLSKKSTIPVDVHFLLTLSNKTLPVIERNQDVLMSGSTIPQSDAEFVYRSYLTPAQLFAQRKNKFFEEQKKYSWLSWNAADEYVKKNLKQPDVPKLAVTK